MPKRGVRAESDNMKVEDVKCLILGPKAQPVPIPTIKECGVTCVPINCTDHWLNKIAGDRCRGDASLVVKEFVDEVLKLLATAVGCCGETGGRPLVVAEDVPAEDAPADEPEPKPMGRAAMGLDDDSDEAELALVPSEPHKKVRKAAAKELRTISCRGMELTVKARDKVRGIAVPLEGPTLLAILRHLREQVSAGEVPEPDPAKCARRQEAISCRDDEDAGRLRWKFDEGAYQVMWEDGDGKFHRTTKGLKVNRADAIGRPTPAPLYKQMRTQMLSKARALWNELDKTKAARYDQFDLIVQ